MVNLLPWCDKNDHFIGSNSLVVYYIWNRKTKKDKHLWVSLQATFSLLFQHLPGSRSGSQVRGDKHQDGPDRIPLHVGASSAPGLHPVIMTMLVDGGKFGNDMRSFHDLDNHHWQLELSCGILNYPLDVEPCFNVFTVCYHECSDSM